MCSRGAMGLRMDLERVRDCAGLGVWWMEREVCVC